MVARHLRTLIKVVKLEGTCIDQTIHLLPRTRNGDSGAPAQPRRCAGGNGAKAPTNPLKVWSGASKQPAQHVNVNSMLVSISC